MVGHAHTRYESDFSSKNDPFMFGNAQHFVPFLMLRGVSTSHFGTEKSKFIQSKK